MSVPANELLNAIMHAARSIGAGERVSPKGERVVHRVGVWLQGEFRPSPLAKQVMQGALFQSSSTSVWARFSAMDDNLDTAARPNVYGLAVRFSLGQAPSVGSSPADLLMLNLPLLPVATGEDFLRLVRALGEMREPGSAAFDLYTRLCKERAEVGVNGALSVQGMLAFLRNAARGRPRSLAEVTYHSIVAFGITTIRGQEHHVRLSWRPEAGDRTLVTRVGTGDWSGSDHKLFDASDDPDAVFRRAGTEIRPDDHHLAFTLDLTLAPDLAHARDTSRAFPGEAPYFSAGRLLLDPVVQDESVYPFSEIRFLPAFPPNGFTPLNDGISETRAQVYPVAHTFDPKHTQ